MHTSFHEWILFGSLKLAWPLAHRYGWHSNNISATGLYLIYRQLWPLSQGTDHVMCWFEAGATDSSSQKIFYSIARFSNANFLISQTIPMLWPLIGIVSRRGFQWMVTTKHSVANKGNAKENVNCTVRTVEVIAPLMIDNYSGHPTTGHIPKLQTV